MPSSTEKQARTMAGAAHNPAFARKVGIPQKVAQDFNQADKGSKLLSSAMQHRAVGGPVYNPEMLRMALSRLRGMNPQMMQGFQGMVRPPPQPTPMPMRQPQPMTGALSSLAGPQSGMQPPMRTAQPMLGPQMQQPPGQVNLGGFGGGQNLDFAPSTGGLATPIGPPRAFARGGPLAPPGLPAASPLPQTRVSPLSSLMSHGMAAQHAGFPGPRKPRIPLPGQLRNINQNINHAQAKLGSMRLR